MTKKFLALFCMTMLFGGCGSSVFEKTSQTPEVAQGTETDTWTPNTSGPWNGSLMLATSNDGLTFLKGTTLVERAGVPNLLHLNDNTIVLVFQYFSNTSEDMFDVIAYTQSDDNGATWTEVQKLSFSDLPVPAKETLKPMDPTLVQLDDGRLRLYFTYHAKGNKAAELYSATTPDDNIASTFAVNDTPALNLGSEKLLDPAVTYFNGMWHHFTWNDSSNNNYHSTSLDGETFTRQEDINLPMDFLGQVVPVGDEIWFYGTGKGAITIAASTDGSAWSIKKDNVIQGADPGVTLLDDGKYLMVYTSINANK